MQKKITPFSLFSWAWCFLYLALCVWGLFSYQRVMVLPLDAQEVQQSLITLGFALVYGVLLVWMTFQWRRHMRWLGPVQFFSSWVIFPVLRTIHHAFPISRDDWLMNLDSLLWGGKSLPAWAMQLEAPWLSELLSFCYFTFYLTCLFSATYFIWRAKPYGKAFFHGLILMYLFGILGYITVPAAGPYVAFATDFPYPVQGGAMTQFLTDMVAKGVTGMDVFPSLHCGITLYILGFYWLTGHKKVAWLITPLFIGTTVATVYLRYHYGIDLIIGAALALSVLFYTHRYILEAKHAQ